MNYWQLVGIFFGSMLLTLAAIFFFGGEPSVWLFIIFFTSLYLVHNAYMKSVAAGMTAGVKNLYLVAKTLIFGVLSAGIFIYLFTVVFKKAPGSMFDGDRVALLIYLPMLALFFMWQAGWTIGAWGKKAIVGFVTLLLFYGVLRLLFPALPSAVDTVLAAINEPLSELGGVENTLKEKLPPGAKAIINGEKKIPGSITAGTRMVFPALCPDPAFYRQLKKGEVVDWWVDKPGCAVNEIKVGSGMINLGIVYPSGNTEMIYGLDLKGRTIVLKEKMAAVSIEAVTDATYRALPKLPSPIVSSLP